MSVSVTGGDELRRKLMSLGPDMLNAVDQGVEVTAGDIHQFAAKSIQKPSFGTHVRRSRQGGGTYSHVAAAPGSAPNNDNGDLVASLAVEQIGKAEYVVGTNLDYGAFLEFGTSKMLSRPWLHPAMMANADNLLLNINKVVDIYIERVTQ